MLPYHSPEIFGCGFQWALGSNVSFWSVVAINIIGIDVIGQFAIFFSKLCKLNPTMIIGNNIYVSVLVLIVRVIGAVCCDT